MISVVIPIYKVEKYIKKCMESFARQTDKDFELILVNDGSPDHSVKLAESVLNGTDISYQVIHTKNCGVSSARNTGMKRAKGDYIIFVDSDDYVSDTFIQDFSELANAHADSDVMFANFVILTSSGLIGKEAHGGRIQIFSADEAQCINLNRTIKYLLPTMLLRREYLIENGITFDEKVRYSEDVQYIWKALAYTRNPVIYLDKNLYYYVLHDNSTMTASGVEKIMTGCKGILRLEREIKDELCERCGKQLVSTWYFSMLHGASKMLTYPDFKTLYSKSHARVYLKRALHSDNLKIKGVSALTIANTKIGYDLMRRF